MCGESEAQIRDKKAELFIGYARGVIEIGDKKYTNRSTDEDRSRFVEFLGGYEKIELAEMIVDFVKNATEA